MGCPSANLLHNKLLFIGLSQALQLNILFDKVVDNLRKLRYGLFIIPYRFDALYLLGNSACGVLHQYRRSLCHQFAENWSMHSSAKFL